MRKWVKLEGSLRVDEGMLDMSWEELRMRRDGELVRTDPWALKDRVMSQEKKDYRAALRSLPQDYDTANEAADAWAEFDIPE